MFGSPKDNDLDGHLFHIDNQIHQKGWFYIMSVQPLTGSYVCRHVPDG